MNSAAPRIIKTNDGNDFAETAALLFWQELEQTNHFKVCLPTSTTPLGMYHYLATNFARRQDAWERMHYVALDEYIGLPPEDERLFQNWLDRELFSRINLPQQNRTVFDSNAREPDQEAARIESWLTENGPLDAAFLGLGTNGHIAFNEPGSPFDSITRVVDLSPETRESNAHYWGDIERVPTQAFTLGLKNIMEARQVILLVAGAHKAQILNEALNSAVTENIPASILQQHPALTIIADNDASGTL